MTLGIRGRLYAIVVIFAAGLLSVAATQVYLEAGTLTERRHEELRGLVETTMSLVAAEHAAVKAGLIKEADAKARALEIIGKLRYNGDNYFWVNDLQPKMVLHPMLPDLNGKALTD